MKYLACNFFFNVLRERLFQSAVEQLDKRIILLPTFCVRSSYLHFYTKLKIEKKKKKKKIAF